MEGFHVVMAMNLQMTILSFKKYVAKKILQPPDH